MIINENQNIQEAIRLNYDQEFFCIKHEKVVFHSIFQNYCQ